MPKSAGSQNTKLTDYPRPSIAVDIAVLTVRDGRLAAVVVEHRLGGLALPGTFLHEGQTLADAASRALQDKAALSEVQFSQLHVFDDPARDERGWVLSVGHSAAVPADRLPDGVRLVPVSADGPAEPLLFDHADIVRSAVDRLRLEYGRDLDPAGLLGTEFTVLQMRRVYEAIFDRPLMKDTFRRLIVPNLEPTGEYGSDFGRPAEIYRRTPNTRLVAKAWVTFVGPD